jgi:hypothetical protein
MVHGWAFLHDFASNPDKSVSPLFDFWTERVLAEAGEAHQAVLRYHKTILRINAVVPRYLETVLRYHKIIQRYLEMISLYHKMTARPAGPVL